MNTNYKYSLDTSSKKFVCPGCGKVRFVRYINGETKQYLPEQYGRCDRAVNCTYHLNPYKDGYGKNPDGTGTQAKWIPPPPKPPEPPSFIDPEIFKASRKNYDQNNFVVWLRSLFDATTVNNLIARYHLGTSKHYSGAVVFWQIDDRGKVRAGKIMGYDSTTGHRIKKPFDQINFVHKVLKLPDFNLKQVYFGTHLLNSDRNKPVALVESEKTAIVASAYFPNLTWLSVGSLTNLNIEKCRPLAGRKIILFPDLNGFELWSAKAFELQKAMPGTQFGVSDLLQKAATEAERKSGLDLCDYLIKFVLKEFQGDHKSKPTEPTKPHMVKNEKTYFLFNLVKSQLKKLNPDHWIIDPEGNPVLTAYNIDILSDDIFYKYGVEVAPDKYLRIYNQVKLFLN